MRVLQINNASEINKIMNELKVDPYGIDIMSPKAISHIIKINSISCIAANILKQEMLSLGGDAALPREVLTGKIKKTDCLLIGNCSQFNRLNKKLTRQPFALDKIGLEIKETLNNYKNDSFVIKSGGYTLDLSKRTHIMGILNLTPDSFSGDGLYQSKTDPGSIMERAKDIIKEGADIIDVGGESTRPGTLPVPLQEELARTIPVIKILAKKIKAPISIDTYKPRVAKEALDNGASIINDISGLRNKEMLKIASRYKAAVVIMHMKGKPRTMQKNPVYRSLFDEIMDFLNKAVIRALEEGISSDKIIIDPGICFGKNLEHNLTLLKNLREFKVLGRPILVGPSRKSFIGTISGKNPQERTPGTITACVVAAHNGAQIVRVHDVRQIKQALKVYEAIAKGNW